MSSVQQTTSFGQIKVDANGKPTLSSTVFGVDINAFVDNLVDAKKIPVTSKNVQITKNTAKVTALQQLQTLTTTLNSKALSLRNPTVTSGGTDIFAQKIAQAQSSTSTAAGTIAAITPDKTASIGSFTLKVNRLATKDAVNSSSTFASNTSTPVSTDGTLRINGQSIALTSGMTLDQIKDAINAKTGTSNVSASVIKVDSTHYKLSLQGTTTGKAIDLTGSDASITTDLSLAGSGATDTSLSAELAYNGVTVTRSTNTVTDLVGGVTFDLFNADPASTLSVDIKSDSSAISTAIGDFVTAYNDVVDFVKTQNTISADGTVPDTAVLFGNSSLRTLYSQIQSSVAKAVGGVSGINNLRDAGISFDATNKLSVDSNKLASALLDHGDEIKNLFSFQTTSTNSNFSTLSRPNAFPNIAGNPIKVNVLETNATGSATSATLEFGGTTYTADVQNGIIRAPAGSPLEGFAFGYVGAVVNSGDAPQTATLTPTQGIADILGGILDTNLSSTGLIAKSITEVQDKNTLINKQIDTLNAQIESYRQRLTDQFTATQANVSRLQQIQNSINSMFNNNSSN
jgi:flagellar hook-associated protein 2